jgi:hypothetical protein
MPAVGQFSCDGCGKSYAWKPELAGRRVKCKCGQKLSVPANDPAAAPMALEDAAPDGFDDLMALAGGASSSSADDEGSYAPAVAAAPPARGAGASGGTCPGCGSRVDAAAVICVNCGQNLKTGKKLKTSKVAGDAAAAGAAASERVPGYRSFGVKDVAGEGMSPEKKKMLAIGLSVLLVAMVSGIVVVVMMGLKNDKERQARLNAKPAKLEKLIENMDAAGGIGAAMHDGTLLKGTQDPTQATHAMQIEHQRNFAKIEGRCEEMLKTNGPEAKAWLESTTKGHLSGHDNAQSIAVVNQLYALGATDVRAAYLPNDDTLGGLVTAGIVATLPTDPAARKKVFAWYDGLPKMIEGDDQPHQREIGQKHISVEFMNK